MVDAVKILGSLLGGASTNSGVGGQLIQSVIQSALSGNSQGGGGLVGNLLGSLMGGQSAQGGQGGNLGGMLGSLLGGGGQNHQPQANDMLGSLGSLLGGGQSQGANAGLGGILSSLSGGSGAGGGALGGSALGALAMTALNSLGNDDPQSQQRQLAQFGEQPTADQNAQAMLLIRAMTNAAKADGRVDEQEREKILGNLGDDVTEEELNFIQQELAAPLNTEQFILSVPASSQQQVYATSLLTITLDTQEEAGYLHQLAQGFGMSPEQCNQVHAKMGAPALYS